MFEELFQFEKSAPNREQILEIITEYSGIPVCSTMEDRSMLFLEEPKLGEESFLVYFEPYPETQVHISIDVKNRSITVATFYKMELSLYFASIFAFITFGGTTTKNPSKSISKRFQYPLSIEELHKRYTKKEEQYAFKEKYFKHYMILITVFYVSIIGIGFWLIFNSIIPALFRGMN